VALHDFADPVISLYIERRKKLASSRLDDIHHGRLGLACSEETFGVYEGRGFRCPPEQFKQVGRPHALVQRVRAFIREAPCRRSVPVMS